MDLPESIVVISDLHLNALGKWRRTLERLAPLWRDARTIIFNGDTIGWHRKLDAALRGEISDEITARCARDGTRAVILSGNADFRISDLRSVSLYDGQALITHGHVLYPSISPWRPRAALQTARTRRALLDMPPSRRDTLEGRLAASQQTLTQLFGEIEEWHARHPALSAVPEIPWFVKNPARLWIALRTFIHFPNEAAAFFERFAPSARFLILGHTHRSGVWKIGDRVVINTGHFCRAGRPLRVRIEAGRVCVEKIIVSPKGFVPGPLLREFHLNK